jgi:hypothetical protein
VINKELSFKIRKGNGGKFRIPKKYFFEDVTQLLLALNTAIGESGMF